jgi:AraC-like DNA-binding protein
MRHIEFIHTDHFEVNYHRTPPQATLSHFIDFFWETKFDGLWDTYPKGFSDVLFPNIGYTYILNLGTPFVMQVNGKKFTMKTDGFLPRQHAMECFHKPGNHLFGIKFRISPVILNKNINFSEYAGYIFPLSYLLEQEIIDKVKKSNDFEERTSLLSNYFSSLLIRHDASLGYVDLVSNTIEKCFQENDFNISLEGLAHSKKIALRTLQRYFEKCTGLSSKQALQVMRIRKATTHLINSPLDFDCSEYGYYDHSHFYRHLKQFLQHHTARIWSIAKP